jgi:nucleoside-diphosphate-sugar epimerase
MQPKTVLVTGATGFIGRATVSELKLAGWTVTKGARSSSQSMGSGFLTMDLTNPDEILALAHKVRFDAIVHLGANVGLTGVVEKEMYVPNVLSTGCLAFLASQWDAHMIYASTAIVCGVKNEAIDSNSLVSPDTPYAQSKWLGEQLIVASHVHHCILRIAGVFGYEGPAHLGLNRAIDGAINGVAPTQIGSGGAMRNYIYVKDVAQAITFALNNRLEGTHLLAGSEYMSISQMMEEICSIFLPGQYPLIKDGPEAYSQVIQPSLPLPSTRGFRDALTDIKEFCQ